MATNTQQSRDDIGRFAAAVHTTPEIELTYREPQLGELADFEEPYDPEFDDYRDDLLADEAAEREAARIEAMDDYFLGPEPNYEAEGDWVGVPF